MVVARLWLCHPSSKWTRLRQVTNHKHSSSRLVARKWATKAMIVTCNHLSSGPSLLLHSNSNLPLICIKHSRSSSRCLRLALIQLQHRRCHLRPNSLRFLNQFSNNSRYNRLSLCHLQTTSRNTMQQTWTCTRRPQHSLMQAFLHSTINSRTLQQVSSSNNSSSNSSSSNSRRHNSS